MDKLAKALEKARGERAETLASLQQNQQANRPLAAPTNISAGAPSQAYSGPTSNAVKISELVMDEYHIIAHRTRSKEADLFRILRTQVLQKMQQSGLRTLGVTSPNYGDGKSTIAINLALSIALDLKQTVLLVDLDLRKPCVTEYLGLNAPVGLTDYFQHDTPIPSCIIRPSFDRLAILPAGPTLENSSEVLGSPKIAALAQEVKYRYADRIVIYDLPPVLAQDDPLVFLPHADGILLVINEGVTRTSDLKSTMHVLANANVVGTVLNNAQTISPLRGRRRVTQKAAIHKKPV